MAGEIGISQQSVSRGIRELLAGGHLYRDGKYLYLNPFTSHTGTGVEHQKAIARMPDEMRVEATVRHLMPVS